MTVHAQAQLGNMVTRGSPDTLELLRPGDPVPNSPEPGSLAAGILAPCLARGCFGADTFLVVDTAAGVVLESSSLAEKGDLVAADIRTTFLATCSLAAERGLLVAGILEAVVPGREILEAVLGWDILESHFVHVGRLVQHDALASTVQQKAE